MSYTKRVEKALRKRPETIADLANYAGEGKEIEKEILVQVHMSQIRIQPIAVSHISQLILCLGFLLLVKILPLGMAQSYIALLSIIGIPYLWWHKIMNLLEQTYILAVGLVVTELMLIGFVLGVFGILYQNMISVALLLLLIGKFGIVEWLSQRSKQLYLPK
ncbi:MAG: hypothetical protein ACW98K_14655 [Candidatus Kariarchaeaceae archaeon]